MNRSWIVSIGNIGDGFTFYGPFDTSQDAANFAELELRALQYTIHQLIPEDA